MPPYGPLPTTGPLDPNAAPFIPVKVPSNRDPQRNKEQQRIEELEATLADERVQHEAEMTEYDVKTMDYIQSLENELDR